MYDLIKQEKLCKRF